MPTSVHSWWRASLVKVHSHHSQITSTPDVETASQYSRGDREEKRIQVSHHWAIWLARAGTITHEQKQEMPHARQPWHFPRWDHAPDLHPSNKLNLLSVGQIQVWIPAPSPSSFFPAKVQEKSPHHNWKGRGATWRCARLGRLRWNVTYCCTSTMKKIQMLSSLFKQPLHWKASILLITG